MEEAEVLVAMGAEVEGLHPFASIVYGSEDIQEAWLGLTYIGGWERTWDRFRIKESYDAVE